MFRGTRSGGPSRTGSSRTGLGAGRSGRGSARPDQVTLSELRQAILRSLAKLRGRDTAQVGAEELIRYAEEVSAEDGSLKEFVFMLLSEPEQESVRYKKEIMRVMAVVATVHRDAARPFVAKTLTVASKFLRDKDTSLRDVCAQATGVMCMNITPPAAARGGEPSLGIYFKVFLQSLAEANKATQTGAAYCLASVACNSPLEYLKSHLPTLIDRIQRNYNSHSCLARDALLSCLAVIVEAVQLEIIRQVPAITSLMVRGLSDKDWGTRKAAAESLQRLAVVLGPSMLPQTDIVLEHLLELKYDKVKPTRDAVAAAIHTYNMLKRTGGETSLMSAGPVPDEEPAIEEEAAEPVPARSATGGRLSRLQSATEVPSAGDQLDADDDDEEEEVSFETSVHEASWGEFPEEAPRNARHLRAQGDGVQVFARTPPQSRDGPPARSQQETDLKIHDLEQDEDLDDWNAGSNAGVQALSPAASSVPAPSERSVTRDHVASPKPTSDAPANSQVLAEVASLRTLYQDLADSIRQFNETMSTEMETRLTTLEARMDAMDSSMTALTRTQQEFIESASEIRAGEAKRLEGALDGMRAEVAGIREIQKTSENGVRHLQSAMESQTEEFSQLNASVHHQQSTRQASHRVASDEVPQAASGHSAPDFNAREEDRAQDNGWRSALTDVVVGHLESAYAKVLEQGDSLQLLRLMEQTGPCLDKLSPQTTNILFARFTTFLRSQTHVRIVYGWIEQALQLQLVPVELPTWRRVQTALDDLTASPDSIGIDARRIVEAVDRHISSAEQ